MSAEAGPSPRSIVTERLELRPFAPGDEDAMALVFADADQLRFWGPPLDREAIRDRIARNIESFRLDGFARCAIVLRDGGELVGDAGLTRTDVEGVEEIELGWVVRPDRGGRGIATEAAAAWRDHAFGPLGLVRIVSMIRRENAPSRRVAEKIGMRVERDAFWNDAPHLVYALDRNESIRDESIPDESIRDESIRAQSIRASYGSGVRSRP
jgi:[ribosomal protein S5]-alanine N-acetyltransferase